MPLYTLRENWSSTKISAKRPSGVARQANNSHRAAASSVAPKRVRMASSKAASLAKWCLGVSSVNQKWVMDGGCMAIAKLLCGNAGFYVSNK